jgi:hypothetical protein
MEEGHHKSKRHIRLISNIKQFTVLRRGETAKPLQFLELMKTAFGCGGNAR